MRPIVAGTFKGKLENAGVGFKSGSDGPDVWVAQYSGDGDLSWQRAYTSNRPNTRVDSATVDPFGNIAIAGSAAALQVEGLKSIGPLDSLYVLKLRADATPVWLRSFEGTPSATTLASDIQSNLWLGSSFYGKVKLDTDVVDGMGNFQGLLLKLGP